MGETPREAELRRKVEGMEQEIAMLEEENHRLNAFVCKTYDGRIRKLQKAVADRYIEYVRDGIISGKVGLKRLNGHDCPPGRQIGAYSGDTVYLAVFASADYYNSHPSNIQVSRPELIDILKTCNVLDRAEPVTKKYLQGVAAQCIKLSPRHSKIMMDALQSREPDK